MSLQVFRNGLNPFPYNVTIDEQQEATAAEIEGHALLKATSSTSCPALPYEIEKHTTLPPQSSACFTLQVRRGPFC
ncbi:hypothetical protein [Rhizobium sp. CF122]|uniref:hypothetical protein n=1 Tax=Rhizobium sp. CF122 TaxID=1144312 RepID=UPI0005679D61|nr:hypothetical protein [Rhizobium sp. CF122]